MTPRGALLADLQASLQNAITDGDKVIVGIDANEDMRTGLLRKMFRDLGLRDAILTRHCKLSPPATC